MPTSLLRQLEQADIACPAGTVVGDASCACAVETSVIDGHQDPTSIASFCAGDYTACPSWRAERESKVGVSKNLDAEIARREIIQQRKQVARERVLHAQRLLKDPGPDGEKFRAKLRNRLAEIERQRLSGVPA